MKKYMILPVILILGLLCGCGNSDRPLSAAEKEILENADTRREVILNSPTEITVTGTCYYVSTDGNDSNDGKSEETPWASLDKVNSANLRSGDGVEMFGVEKLSLHKMALHTLPMVRA